MPREGALSRCRGAGHSPDRTYPVVAASPSFPAYSLTLQLTYSRSGRFLPLFRAPFAAGLSPGWPGSAYAWPGQTHLANETTLINSERVKVASLPKPSLPPSPRARLPSLLRSWGDVRRSPTRGMSPSPPRDRPCPAALSPPSPGKGARYRPHRRCQQHLHRHHQPRFSLFLKAPCFLIFPPHPRGKSPAGSGSGRKRLPVMLLPPCAFCVASAGLLLWS